jgi:hypothetical protein
MRTLATIQNEGNGMICTLKTLTDCPLSEFTPFIGMAFFATFWVVIVVLACRGAQNNERKEK